MSFGDRDRASRSVGKLRAQLEIYGGTAAAVVAAALVRHGLALTFGTAPPFILFFPVIVVVALWGGRRLGLFATALSSLISWYFVFPFSAPTFSAGSGRGSRIVALCLFVAVGILSSEVGEQFLRRMRRVQEFEKAVEGLDEMIAVVDHDYRYLMANQAFLNARGMKKEEVLGRSAEEVLNPGMFEKEVKGRLDECFQGKVVEYEMLYRYPERGERELLLRYFPIFGRSGVERVASVIQDITDLRRADHLLRESEDRYRDLIEHSEDLVCTHDLNGRLLSVNPAPARALGYEVDELLQKPMRDLMAPEFRAQFDEYLERIRTLGIDRGFLCVMARSGERRIWSYTNTLRRDGVKSPIVRGMARDVTEEKKAQTALRKSEERYRLLFEQNIAGVATCNLRGEIQECNEAWARTLGFDSGNEMRGRRTSEFYYDAGDRERIFAELEVGRSILGKEVRLRRKDGTAVWVLFNCVMRSDAGGESIIQSTSIDISERKQAEEELRRSEEGYRSFVARSSEGIFRVDLDVPVRIDLPEQELIHHILHDSRLVECNDTMARMYGHETSAGLVGKRLSELRAADDPQNIELAKEYVRLGFRMIDREWHEMDVHGNPKVFRNSVIGTVDEGMLKGLWGIQRDVTEQAKLEEARSAVEAALRKSEEHFRILVDQASDGIFIADQSGRYLDVNRAGVEMLGYTREEILERSIRDIVIADDQQRVQPEVERFAGGATIRSDWKFQRKDGSVFPGEVSGKQLPDGRLQGILRDVTERRKAEEELRRSDERFRVALKDSPITVFNQDRDLRYTWIYNPQLYAQQEVLGKTDEELFGTKSAAELTELKLKVLKTGQAQRAEIAIGRNGKTYAVDMSIEPLFNAGGRIAGITGASMDIARLREMTDRLQAAKDKLAQEKSYLEKEIEKEFETIIGQSAPLREVLKKARIVAPTDSTVLLLGETGTGKELVARSVHALSTRRERTFVKLNCAAVPSGLLESELFGHEKGAFTGAVSQKIGRIELADKGTLLLDEIGELPLELQPKLLRVLQDREFERLGGVKTLRVDVRIIAATNRDLRQDIADKNFREDLFYRLNVFPIELPPLRDRREDIPVLVEHFVRKHAARMAKTIDVIPEGTLEVLRNWDWPGNVRELENMIERMVILSKERVLAAPPQDLIEKEENSDDNLNEIEREHIIRVLRETRGVLAGIDGAASRLGVKRTTLQSMLKRMGIEAQEFRRGNGTYGREAV